MGSAHWIILLSLVGAAFEFVGVLLVGRRFVDLNERIIAMVRRLRGVERLTSVGTSASAVWSVEATTHAWRTERFDDVREDLDELWRQLSDAREHFSRKIANAESTLQFIRSDVHRTEQEVRQVRVDLTALVDREVKAPKLGVGCLLVGLGAFVAANMVGAFG